MQGNEYIYILKTLPIILCIVVVPGIIFNFWGLRVRDQLMRSLKLCKVMASGQLLATGKNGRQISYCTYGKQDPASAVVINMHGSDLEAGFERDTFEKVCGVPT